MKKITLLNGLLIIIGLTYFKLNVALATDDTKSYTDTLSSIEIQGSIASTPQKEVAPTIEFKNFPNPFSHATKFYFQSPYEGIAVVKIHDAVSGLAWTIFNEKVESGKQVMINFDAAGLPQGIYTAELSFNQFTKFTKIQIN